MDYSSVTEAEGVRITREAWSMLYTRYAYAADFSLNKDILEVACGAGQGLGYLAKKSKKVVGGDFTENLIKKAKKQYGSRIPLLSLDAHALPFKPQSFDVVILYEAIYYLKNPGFFLEECRRVLRKKGVVLICMANNELEDFNPSPFSPQYLTAQELSVLLEKHNFIVQLFGAFPSRNGSIKGRLISLIKKSAVRFNLMPKTMRGKELLKRMFLGELKPFPSELEEKMADYASPIPIPNKGRSSNYKVIYAVSHLQ